MPRTHTEKEIAPARPYWLIVNRKRGCIWEGSLGTYKHDSYESAKKEFDYQVASLKGGKTHGFVIEKVDPPGWVRNARELEKKSEVDSLVKGQEEAWWTK